MSDCACTSCGRPLGEGQRFCSHCGADASLATAAATATSTPQESSPEWTTDGGARFSAGTVVDGRYRIVGLLGRGGMGEVYRADDLKLARPVALKFLPTAVEREPRRLNRLLNEVRTALKVSHPNVCRVHDVQQESGRHFITMEFVDGDDLSVLLRRIGRLPPDKALEIARQLCAGLAAAHAAGVLHRDLKPANIMIDGRGQVKITDFGLAGLVGGFEGEEVRAGTPAYMAPEQLAGKEVSEASDLYALGLVLYEVYTGNKAYEGSTAAELARLRSSAPTSPTSHITDIDPAVERVILRCLERDPEDRPRSAMAVSAALPGGDPLADALAAGETPAPELVAEAGATGGLKTWQAWALLATFLAGLAVQFALNRYTVPLVATGLPKSGEVLQEKAREILHDLGLDAPRRESIYAFSYNYDYAVHLNREGIDAATFDDLGRAQPPIVHFGYRQSPEWLNYESNGSVGDWIRASPPRVLGEVRLSLDLAGRLAWLDAVPPQTLEGAADPSRATDWDALLIAADFDPLAVSPSEPRWYPPRAFDDRRAWDAVYPDAPDIAVRIEAASLSGMPVAFRIIEPWSKPALAEPRPLTGPGSIDSGPMAIITPALFLVLVATMALLAWRNVRLGRGDRRTAVRFALAAASLRMVWYVATRHVPDGTEIEILTAHLAWSMYRFGLAYAFYLAVEPYMRKLWPRALTSWVRLFDGRFRDPLVGRDILAGLALTSVFTVGVSLSLLAYRMGIQSHALTADAMSLEALRGLRGAVIGLTAGVTQELITLFFIATILLVSKLLLRRDVLAALPIVALMFGFVASGWDSPLFALVTAAIFVGTITFALLRVGFLAYAVVVLYGGLAGAAPLTFDLGAWWAAPSWIVLVTTVLLAFWSFRVSLAGRPVFRETLFDR